jgi:hypothetical protein
MRDYMLRAEELAHIQNLRHLTQAERDTIFALADQFRRLNDDATKRETLPEGVVPIRRTVS